MSLNLRRLGVTGLAVVGALSAVAPVFAEPSLANLLRGAERGPDPVQPYADRLAALERRPFARDSAVQRVLSEARAELSKVRTAYHGGAADEEVERGLELVQAVLSAADRIEARAFAAAALARLKLQAEAAELAAQRAKVALEEARRAPSEERDRGQPPADVEESVDARGKPAP